MRRGLLVLGVVLGLAGPAGAAGAESILAFDTEVSLEGDDAFTVVETLRYDFGDERRHGIFRDVPVRYGRGRSADYRIGLEVLEVTDGDGRARPWRTSRSGRHLRIRIGDPDATVTGVQVYRIRYRVSRGILFFEDHDELYWNATGNAWPVGIGAARVRVLLPGVWTRRTWTWPATPARRARWSPPAGSERRAAWPPSRRRGPWGRAKD